MTAELNRAEIRAIFLKHGFTIKPGCDDLKPYVYEAAEALLTQAAQAPQAVVGAELPPLPPHIEVGGEGWDIEDFMSWKTFTVENMEQYACAAIAADRAQQPGAAAPDFEAWAKGKHLPIHSIDIKGKRVYGDERTQAAWLALHDFTATPQDQGNTGMQKTGKDAPVELPQGHRADQYLPEVLVYDTDRVRGIIEKATANLRAQLARQGQGDQKIYGWVQFIDGRQTQNFARDEAELERVKEITSISCKNAHSVEYVPVYASPAQASAAQAIGAPNATHMREAFETNASEHHNEGCLKRSLSQRAGKPDPYLLFDMNVEWRVWQDACAWMASTAPEQSQAASQSNDRQVTVKQAGVEVPGGWKLVPVEPTPEMQEAGFNTPGSHAYNASYRAMLAAAPSPAAPQQPDAAASADGQADAIWAAIEDYAHASAMYAYSTSRAEAKNQREAKAEARASLVKLMGEQPIPAQAGTQENLAQAVEQPADDARDATRMGDDAMIAEAVERNNVYGVLPNSASTMSIGHAVLAAERRRAAQMQVATVGNMEAKS